MKIKSHNKYFALALILLVLDFFYFQLSDSWIVFDVFARLFIWFFAMVVVLAGFAKLIFKKKNFTIASFYFFLLASFSICILYSVEYLTKEKGLILRAFYIDDTNGMTLELFKNGNYKIYDNSIMGGDVKKGTYNLMKDTIILDNKYPLGEDRKFFPNKLLINDSVIELLTPDTKDRDWFKFNIAEKKLAEEKIEI